MREIEAQIALLQGVLRQLPAGVVVVDAATGQVVLVNEEVERIAGVRLVPGLPFAPADPERTGGLKALGRDGRPLGSEAWPLARAIATGEKVQAEMDLARPDGRRVAVDVSAAPVRDESGRTIAGLLTLTDLAALRLRGGRNGSRSHDLDRRRDEFLAMLAHELRNPLAPLRNWLEVLALHPCEERTVERAREAMVRQVQQLARRVDELLDVSRVARRSIDLLRERIDLSSVLDRAVEACLPLQAHRHDLHVSFPRCELTVEGDSARLQQVFLHLLDNAAKYTPEGGRIRLEVEKDGCQAVVRVRDSGVGIPPGMLHRVFDLFAQVERGGELSEGGLGIGLTLARGLVEMHGGTVEAHSEGFGRGSEFIIRLPLVRNSLLPQPEPERRPADVLESGLKVLVVEDNLDAAESLGTLLVLYGCEVHTVHDGPSALGAAEAFQPGLVLLDIGLPVMDGFEVARRLRHQPALEDSRMWLVALTGYGSEEDRRQAREAGFDRYLVKPVDPRELRELIASVV